MRNEACKVVLSQKNGEQGLNKNGELKQREDIIKFKNEGSKFKHPFNICLDFEATLKPIDKDDNINTNDTTTKYQEHIPNSCGFKYTCIHNQHSEPVKIFNTSDQNLLLKDTIEELETLAKKSYRLIQQNKDNKILTTEHKQLHAKTNVCNNCQCGV